MKSLISWFIRNPVAANLMMLLILFSGALSLGQIRIEGFPKLAADTIEVSVIDFGASAEEVDRSITRSLEQAFEGLPGLRNITGFSVHSQGVVYLRKQDNYDLDRLLENARLRLDNITTLPSSAERPSIRRMEFQYPALIVQVYGDAPQAELQKTAAELKQRLLSLSQISEIKQWGEREAEISIEVNQQKLRQLGLNLQELASVIERSSQRYRSGDLKTSGGRIQLRADRLAQDKLDFASIPIINEANGRVIRLGEIAEIKDSFSDDDISVIFQGKPTIGFEVAIAQDGNILDVNDAVQQMLLESKDILSESVSAEVWANQSEFVSDRLSMLQSNAWQGLILVFIILSIFLRVRLAFWVAMGIPICVMGTLAIIDLPSLNYSLNDITTFGLIIVLGILVDDAVVVGESVYSAQQKNPNRIQATEEGVEKVATATIFGVLTTIAAFYPMTVMDSALGKLLGSFAVIVIVALLFSLLESKFILPSHLVGKSDHSDKLTSAKKKSKILIVCGDWLEKIRYFCDSKLQHFTEHSYGPLLAWCIERRKQVLVLFALLLVFITACLSQGYVRTVFFPAIPGNIISIKMEMDSQMPFAKTLENAEKIESVARELNREWVLKHSVNQAPIQKIMRAVIGADSTEIYAELSSASERPIDTLSILNAWRDRVGLLEGAIKLEFSATEETAGGFELEVYASERHTLEKAVSTITQLLSSTPHVHDARSELRALKPELRLRLNDLGESLGLRIDDIAAQIGDGFGGLEFQRFVRGKEEVKAYLRYPLSERKSLADLHHQQIRTAEGEWLPLMMVVEVESHYVPQFIWRKDHKLGASISATIDKKQSSSRAVYEALMASDEIQSLLSDGPKIVIKPAGELEQEGEVSSGLRKALAVAMFLIFALLAIPLKSYLQALIIISVVPLGFIGAVIGHWLMDVPLSVFSFFGMLALAGIVVNDSLVLVTRFNHIRDKGEANALIQACKSRVRAIFLTTVTTVCGLLPIMMETSEQAQYLIPAAISLAFGELFATLLTLILIPILLSFSAGSVQVNSIQNSAK